MTIDAEGFTSSIGDANDRILTRTVDDDDNSEDQHVVYDWGTDSTVLLGETTYDGLMVDPLKIDTVKTNSYTARGRLAQTDLDEGGDTQIETRSEFEYDDDGIRVSQETTTYIGGVQQSNDTRHFVFDKRNPTGYAQEIDEFTGGGSGTTDRQFAVDLDMISQAVEDIIRDSISAASRLIFMMRLVSDTIAAGSVGGHQRNRMCDSGITLR